MKGRLLKGLQSVTEIHQMVHDDAPGFIAECLLWIFSSLVAVFYSIFGWIAEIFRTLGHLLVSGFLAVYTTVFSEGVFHWIAQLIHAACVGLLDTYDAVTRGVKHVADFLISNSKQFVDKYGHVILVIVILIVMAILILYFAFPLITCVVIAVIATISWIIQLVGWTIVSIVQLLGFGAGGIVAGSCAATFMAFYCGGVPVGSACAVLQSIGALGAMRTRS